MGTRHLTMVVSDQKVRVAQYGQWDGYPKGQGTVILDFLRKANLKRFRKRVEAVREITPEEDKMVEALGSDKWPEKYPYLSRDIGAKILPYIYQHELPTGLSINPEFAADSVFCEWAYVIDLDTQKFEVYKGFNKTPLTASDRFYHLRTLCRKECPGYYPVKMIKEFSLSELPTKTAFLKHFQ